MTPEIIRDLNVVRSFPAPEFPRFAPIPDSAWHNGMLVRMPNHLGDAIMALPALAALKTIVPECCALMVAAPAGQRDLYAALPNIVDDFFPLPPHSAWSKELRREIFRCRLGIGVLFNNSLRDAWSMRRSGVPRLYGYAARCRSWLLRETLPLPRRPKNAAWKIHQANLYYALARAFGASPWSGEMIDLQLPTPENLSSQVAVAGNADQMLLIASGAAYGAAKRYPADYYRRIAEFWLEQGGSVAVVGSAAERSIGDEVIAGLPQDCAVNLSGETADLAELMWLIKQSQAVVANDSGIMHLAAALGAEGITVFGPTDYTSTAPISARWHLINSPAECSPCLRRVCPRGDQCCMRQLSPEIVIGELRKVGK